MTGSVAQVARALGWERPEGAGWWVKDGVGGICKEADGKWYFYRYPYHDKRKRGPYRTLMLAIQEHGGTMTSAAARVHPDPEMRQEQAWIDRKNGHDVAWARTDSDERVRKEAQA